MICENCGSEKESKILDSREREGFTYRKRKCVRCGYEYITHERFVRGVRSTSGPRLMYLNEMQEWTEAVWLELRDGKLIATSIQGIDEDSVHFSNSMVMRRSACLHNWRVWDRRPSEDKRREERWQ